MQGFLLHTTDSHSPDRFEELLTRLPLAWISIGFLAGIWVFCFVAIHGLFEHRTWRLIFINGGYSIAALTLMGAIIGLWR